MRKLFCILMLTGCIKTEMLNTPNERNIDTLSVTKTDTTRVEPPDTTQVVDTSRVQIGFVPSVDGWNGADVDMNL